MEILIIVDLQKDFLLPTGKLFIGHDTTEYRKKVSEYINNFKGFVVATKDTHNEDSCEFKSFPSHCIDNTLGWEFIDEIDLDNIDKIFEKQSYTSEKITDYIVNEHLIKDQSITIYVVGVCGCICVHDIISGIVNKCKNKLNFVPNIKVPKELVDDFDLDMMKFSLKRLEMLYGVAIV